MFCSFHELLEVLQDGVVSDLGQHDGQRLAKVLDPQVDVLQRMDIVHSLFYDLMGC